MAGTHTVVILKLEPLSFYMWGALRIRMHMDKGQKFPRTRVHCHIGLDFTQTPQCNEEGGASGLQTPGPSSFSYLK